jgi:phosphatidylglycerophosphate synthase
LAIGIYLLRHTFAKATPIRPAAGIFVAIVVPAIFYTAYYVGWFSIFFLLLLSAASYSWVAFHSGGHSACRGILWQRRNWHTIFPYCALSVICFIPFLLTYLPVLVELGGRPYDEIVTMLPSLIDYVNVGPSNWLWGRTLYSAVAGLGSRPMAHELTRGLPCCLLLTYLASSLYFIRTIRDYHLTVTKSGACKIVVGRNEANHDDKLRMLAAGLGAAILLAWVLMLKIENHSLWWLVTKLVPGAGSIRAVYRFQHVLAFPLAIVVAIAVHQTIKYTASHIDSRLKRSACFLVLGLLCLLLVGEQFNSGSLANYSKQQQRNMLAGIHHPPQQAKVFVVLPPAGLKVKPRWELQIDAMIIAQKYGLHTINGYSGQTPLGWDGIDDYGKPRYVQALRRWIQDYNLENDQLYYLDETTGAWLSSREYRLIQQGG